MSELGRLHSRNVPIAYLQPAFLGIHVTLVARDQLSDPCPCNVGSKKKNYVQTSQAVVTDSQDLLKAGVAMNAP